MPGKRYQQEHLDWLRAHRARLSESHLPIAFRAQFGWAPTASALDQVARKHGVKAQHQRGFVKGSKPWNTGLKGVSTGGESTRFKSGEIPHQYQPIGSYRLQSDLQTWQVKVADATAPGLSRYGWAYVHHLTWTDAHGPIPPGHVVVFIDGDPDNCMDVANLLCVSKAVVVRANQLGLANLTDLAQRRALWELARLHQAAHDKAKDLGLSIHERRRLLPNLGRAARVDRGVPAPAEAQRRARRDAAARANRDAALAGRSEAAAP